VVPFQCRIRVFVSCTGLVKLYPTAQPSVADTMPWPCAVDLVENGRKVCGAQCPECHGRRVVPYWAAGEGTA
jgi:hypothetical protein